MSAPRPGDDRRAPTAGSEAAPRRRLTPEEKVVRAFFRDDRLVSIPARAGKRELLLRVIVDRVFPEDRAYEEKEVNMRLALLHPDVAALRRYLVDAGLMTRDAGIYRRGVPLKGQPRSEGGTAAATPAWCATAFPGEPLVSGDRST